MSNKNKFILSIAGVVVSTSLLIAVAFLAEAAIISFTLTVILTILCTLLVFIAIFYAAKSDYETGVYECRNCGHTFKPTFTAYIFGVHTLTTRCLKCPECGKSTMCKRKSI